VASERSTSHESPIQPASRGVISTPDLGGHDRGGEQRPERSRPEAPDGDVPGAHGARHRDRERPAHGDGVEATLAKRLARGQPRRGARTVEAVHGARAGLVVEEEQVAPEPAHVRIDRAEHGVHGDRRIERVAAVGEHLAPDGRGRVVRRGDGAPALVPVPVASRHRGLQGSIAP
jgi:hypothetical protein